MLKCKESGQDFDEALHSLNTMRKSLSPAHGELFWQEAVSNQLPRIGGGDVDPLGKQKREDAAQKMRQNSEGRKHTKL